MIGGDFIAGLALGISSWVHIWRDELDDALRIAHEALRIGERVGSAMSTRYVGLFHAEALLETGCCDQVPGVLLEAAGGAAMPLLERPWRARAYQVLVRAALATGDRAAAREWLEQARTDVAGVRLDSRQADLWHAEAAVLLDAGDGPAAVAAAHRAVEAAERGGVPVEAGRARILAGRALVLSGDRRAGIRLLEHAERDLAALGAHRYQAEAARELRRLGRRIRRPATAGAPSALTGREREVALLVAAGRSNRQIATRLLVSEKTVEAHVTAVLRKLGLPSRAAVGAAFLAEESTAPR